MPEAEQEKEKFKHRNHKSYLVFFTHFYNNMFVPIRAKEPFTDRTIPLFDSKLLRSNLQQ